MLSSCVSSPPRSSQESSTLCSPFISSHPAQPGHSSSLQPDAKETFRSKLREPHEECTTVPPSSPDKPGGRRSHSHSHCWVAASSNRRVVGHSHKRPGTRAMFLAPGVSSFPRKQISRSSVVFWQPVLRPAGENSKVPGQKLAPGLSPARRAKSDVTACLRQLLVHSTAW